VPTTWRRSWDGGRVEQAVKDFLCNHRAIDGVRYRLSRVNIIEWRLFGVCSHNKPTAEHWLVISVQSRNVLQSHEVLGRRSANDVHLTGGQVRYADAVLRYQFHDKSIPTRQAFSPIVRVFP